MSLLRSPQEDAGRDKEEHVPLLRVAGTSDPKNMAIAIQSRVNDFRTVKLEAVGPKSVNQATKSIAIARANAENLGKSLACYPDFIHIPSKEEGQGERSAIQFVVYAAACGREQPVRRTERDGEDHGRVIRVAQTSDAKAVANTISAALRTEEELRVQAVGAASVNAAVKAIAIARRTLSISGYEVSGFPEFVRVAAPTPEKGDHSGIRWTLTCRSFRGQREAPSLRAKASSSSNSEIFNKPPPYRVDKSLTSAASASSASTTSSSDKVDDKVPKIQELRVATTSEPKAVAGAIATRIRNGETVRITVMGAASVNQCVKALAVARTYIEEDGGDFATYATFIHLPGASAEEAERSAIQLTVVPCQPVPVADKEIAEYKVGSGTNPKATAGAIANCVRTKKRCKLEALGRDAVSQAIKAIAIGRANLEADNIDIAFVTIFRTMFLSNGRRSALELVVVPVSQ